MSPIRTIFILLTGIFLSIGCGRGSDSGKVFVSEKGHPDNWAGHLSVGTKNFHGTFIKSVPSGADGAKLFVLHCAPCHGNDGSGKIGPDIRVLAASAANINNAIQTRPVMQGHASLSQNEVQSIADYVASLAVNPPLIGAFDPNLCTQCHGVNLDGGIAMVSCFSCHNGPDGSIGHPAGWSSPQNRPVAFHGPYGRDFSGGCTTCHGVDLNGGRVFLIPGNAPACVTCHNGTIAPAL